MLKGVRKVSNVVMNEIRAKTKFALALHIYAYEYITPGFYNDLLKRNINRFYIYLFIY
jgi:hypothetical protein